MLKPMTACLIAATLAAAPAIAQTGDRPTATGSGSSAAGSPSMRPGTPGDATVTSPASPAAPTMGSTSTTGSPPAMAPATTTTGSQPAMPPSTTTTTAPSSTGMSGNMATTGAGGFIAQQQMGQMLASKLIGTTVVSQNNETIGDVNDILFDRNGQVMAAVIGVGGFLGIGEKDVAVPFQQLEFMTSAASAGMATTTTAPGAPAPGTATTSTMAPSATAPNTTATTGSTTAAAARDAMPNRVMLKMTKADLQSAPTFAEYDRTPAATGAATTTTQPRQ